MDSYWLVSQGFRLLRSLNPWLLFTVCLKRDEIWLSGR